MKKTPKKVVKKMGKKTTPLKIKKIAVVKPKSCTMPNSCPATCRFQFADNIYEGWQCSNKDYCPLQLIIFERKEKGNGKKKGRK